jgi:hypothetical protein
VVIDFLNPSSSSFCTVSSSFCCPGRRLFQWRSSNRSTVDLHHRNLMRIGSLLPWPNSPPFANKKRLGKRVNLTLTISGTIMHRIKNKIIEPSTQSTSSSFHSNLDTSLLDVQAISCSCICSTITQSHHTLIEHKKQLCLPRHRHQLLPHIPKLLARV